MTNQISFDIPVPPLSPEELADLEAHAGRKFLSENHARAYKRRQLNAWIPAQELFGARSQKTQGQVAA